MPNRFRFLLLVLALLGLGFVAIRYTRFDSDPLTLLPRKMPEVEGLRVFQEHFGREIDLILSLEGEQADEVEAAAAALCERLRTADNLVARADWEAPGTERPALFGELLAWAWMNGETPSLKALAAKLSAGRSSEVLESAVATLTTGLEPEELFRASTDPLGLTNLGPALLPFGSNGPFSFASEDGRCRVLFIDAPGELYDYRQTIPWLARLRAEVARWQRESAGIRIEETGRAPYIAEIAGDMRFEMVTSVCLTLGMIVGLFWLAYRRMLPLFYLVLCLALTFLGTLAIGTLLYDRLGASSVGFAAILIGVVVDYGFILYQDSWSSGVAGRKASSSGIVWAALTTAAVFAGLNLSSLPGASQLGTLIAVGVLLGAGIMLQVFPWLLSLGRDRLGTCAPPPSHSPVRPRTPFGLTLVLGLTLSITLALKGFPGISASAEALRPKHSHALSVFERLGERLSAADANSARIIVTADSDATLREALRRIKRAAAPFEAKGFILSTPLAMVPDREACARNRSVLAGLISDWPRLKAEADAAGLSEDALDLAAETFASWRNALASPPDADLYPDSQASRWMLEKVIARDAPPRCALARLAFPPGENEERIESVLEALNVAGGKTAGWEHLRPAILRLMRQELLHVVLPMAGILAAMLFLAFRSLRGVFLSLATLTFGFGALLAFMAATDLHWNLINLAGVPLLLGAGLDYSIHMQLALRNTGGRLSEVRRTTGRALVLCGISTSTGFGTLCLSANAGASSLGVVCAAGIALTMLGAVFLLPHWWLALQARD